MLEYLAFKKFKKHKEEEKVAEGVRGVEGAAAESSENRPSLNYEQQQQQQQIMDRAVLEESDQAFIERVLAEANEVAPPLPRRAKTPEILWDSSEESGTHTPATVAAEAEAEAEDGKQSGKGKKKATDGDNAKIEQEQKQNKKNRFSFNVLTRVKHIHDGSKKKSFEPVATAAPMTEEEVERETADLTRVLEDLNLAARNDKAVAPSSLPGETAELVAQFTLVFKDLMNGVPTAYDDLRALIEDHDGVLSRNYEKLPSSLKKLITTLPTKLTSTLAPELLAVAAEAQGMQANASGGPAGKTELKEAAKNFLTPSNLSQLATKPGALVGLLKGIVNALKARWPAFIGTNIIWAVAMSILMFVLWYCHKRGKEVRLERESSRSGEGEGEDDIVVAEEVSAGVGIDPPMVKDGDLKSPLKKPGKPLVESLPVVKITEPMSSLSK